MNCVAVREVARQEAMFADPLRQKRPQGSSWFPAVFSGTISVSGLKDSLRKGAWSLDIFRLCAVVADEVCNSHLPERRFENSPPFQGWD